MLLVFLFFAVTYGDKSCASGFRTWKSDCGVANTDALCSQFYSWDINVTTANYNGVATYCYWSPVDFRCKSGASSCYPDCVLISTATGDARHKIGGPNGLVCSSFTTQADCAKYYVDDYGDRWCFWKNGVCNTGTLCYN